MTEPTIALRLPQPQPREERSGQHETALERAANEVAAWAVVATAKLRCRRHLRAVARVRNAGEQLAALDDEALRERARALRAQLRQAGGREAVLVETLALVVEAAGRTLDMQPFDCQIAGAYALMRGQVVEMETGEGKTLTSALAAAASALAGTCVHAVTVNDYLAQRDAEQLAPFYAFLGLEVGLVLPLHDEAARRRAYAADIVHVTGKELVFDYLRDRLASGRRRGDLQRQLQPLRRDAAASPRQRGLAMAIIDEVDSVLIDEARQPLVISQQAEAHVDLADLMLAREDALAFELERDFVLESRERRAELTVDGRLRLAERANERTGRWRLPAWREELVRQALAAEHLYRRDDDYVVQDGRIGLVDEHTGRVLPDRSWSAGLHEMIEIKEGIAPRAGRSDIARLTYQRFFRRYRRLSGMTGTAREVARELWAIYRLPSVRLPTNKPLRRIHDGMLMAESEQEKWRRVAERVKAQHERGRPVLIGTRTVGAARAASAVFGQIGLPHALLSAEQNSEEAAVIARAGEPGRITIATNMAGRGTDIRLGEGVAAAGGLHVVMSEMHEAGRIDRQLAGRCARQGDPGSWEAILSWQDPLLQKHLPSALGQWIEHLPEPARRLLAPAALRWAQQRAERLHARMRRDLLRADELLEDLVAFSGTRV